MRTELNARGVAGTATLARRLREMSEGNVDRNGHARRGVEEVDFRRASKEIHLPLMESDARRLFTHFEVWNIFSMVTPRSILFTGDFKTIRSTSDYVPVSPLLYGRKSLPVDRMRDFVLFMTVWYTRCFVQQISRGLWGYRYARYRCNSPL